MKKNLFFWPLVCLTWPIPFLVVVIAGIKLGDWVNTLGIRAQVNVALIVCFVVVVVVMLRLWRRN